MFSSNISNISGKNSSLLYSAITDNNLCPTTWVSVTELKDENDVVKIGNFYFKNTKHVKGKIPYFAHLKMNQYIKQQIPNHKKDLFTEVEREWDRIAKNENINCPSFKEIYDNLTFRVFVIG